MMSRREVIKGLKGLIYDLKTCDITTHDRVECIKEAIKHLQVDFFDGL